MGKIEDLQKRRNRLAKELEKGEQTLKKQNEICKTKRATLEQLDMDIVSQLLVDKGMDMKDLMNMLGNNNAAVSPSSNGKVVNEENHSNLGGQSDEV
ncbi:hypothetical protein SAMN04487821_12738 [Enterococcus malodoratus]|uniref:hypothetical protein n=1 Tax=Enterococcus malodoratus TaxID=71451 RepID=UPI0008D18D69|nr:hypothetical protein [Enterococcus malodoratus]SET88813.1 hypothetical protein SAMN04487821_12738 [Enterococcus malodoratus]